MKLKWTKPRWFSWLQSSQPAALPAPLPHATPPANTLNPEPPLPTLPDDSLGRDQTAPNPLPGISLSPQITLTGGDSSSGAKDATPLDAALGSVSPPSSDSSTSPSPPSDPPKAKSPILSGVKGILGIASSALSGTAFAGVPKVCLQIITSVEVSSSPRTHWRAD